MMMEFLSKLSWKFGYDIVSMVFFGEPKFPMPNGK